MLQILFTSAACDEIVNITASCTMVNGKPQISMTEPDNNSIAWANWTNAIHQEGWYKLHIHGKEGADEGDMMTCAGYLEGYLGAGPIFNHFMLIRDIKGYTKWGRKYPEHVQKFMSDNLKYVRLSVDTYRDVKYWQEIGLILKQFDGLREGYNAAANESAKMDEFDHWFFQSAGDMFDIAAMFKDDVPAKEFREHCSGLVRLTDDYSDVFFSHDAWSDYRELHGELKEYHFPIERYNAKRIVMSTRIGKLASYDDFYMADSGLFVIETTLNNYNDKLYDVCVPQSLFTWMRAVHATWMAHNGTEWAQIFIKHNSGTYNNQYVIVDSNKFVRGQKPTKDLLWIIEQFPGTYRMSDVTYQLVEDGYFPSVNTPWHQDLYELAGYPELVKSMGEWGAYRSNDKSPRFLIMKRDARRIKTFDDFKEFMRYNEYERDNFSQHDPAQQISSRYDLRTEANAPYGAKNNFGALDSKCLRLTEARTLMRMHAVASPPFSERMKAWSFGVPPFEKVEYYGLPKLWNFTWTNFTADGFDVCATKSQSECMSRAVAKMCGYCLEKDECMPGDKGGPFFAKCESGWKYPEEMQSWALPVIITTCVVVVIFALVVYGLAFAQKRKNRLP